MRYVIMIFGNLLITGAYAMITVPHSILNGRTTSFAMVVSQATGWPIPSIVNFITLFYWYCVE